MTLIEYAKELGIELNSAQLQIAEIYQKAKDNGENIQLYLPRMNRKLNFYQLIKMYENNCDLNATSESLEHEYDKKYKQINQVLVQKYEHI